MTIPNWAKMNMELGKTDVWGTRPINAMMFSFISGVLIVMLKGYLDIRMYLADSVVEIVFESSKSLIAEVVPIEEKVNA